MNQINEIVSKNKFFINQIQQEKLFWTSAAFSYEFMDLDTRGALLKTQEPPLSMLTKLFRIDRRYRGYTPFDITITTLGGEPVVRLKRGISFLLSKVQIFDGAGTLIGRLTQKFAPLRANFRITDPNGATLFTIQGTWADWDFQITDEMREIAFLSKGAGESLLTELLTTKDSYALKLDREIPESSPLRLLLLASAIAVDIACNE